MSNMYACIYVYVYVYVYIYIYMHTYYRVDHEHAGVLRLLLRHGRPEPHLSMIAL